MRMLKFIAVGLVGWFIYEMLQGESQARSERQRMEPVPEPGRPNVTGPGGGLTVETGDASGTSVRRTVGRGVIER